MLFSPAIVSALKQLSSRADNLQKIKEWKHYRITGVTKLATENGTILKGSGQAGAHVRYSGKVERYLDSKKRVLYQMDTDRVVVFDAISIINTQYRSGYYIHEWVHAQNNKDGKVIRRPDGSIVGHNHASQILLSQSEAENLSFSAAYLNPASWFSYIANKDEQQALRSNLSRDLRNRHEREIYGDQQ